MAKIKFDVTGQDPEESVKGFAESPRPGVYQMKLVECSPGYAKGDNGEDDTQRPHLRIVMEVVKDKKFKGGRVWDYISMTEASKWKYDQFLQAFGISSKKKRKGTFDTDKIIGKVINVRVKAGTNLQGEYRGELGAYLLPKDDDEDYDEDDLDAEEEELDEEDLEDEEEDEEDEDEDEDEEDEDDDEDEDEEEGEYDEDELMEMSKSDLEEVAAEFDVEFPEGKLSAARRKTIVAAILEAQGEGEEEDDEDDEEPLTMKELKALSIKELREIADKYGVGKPSKEKQKLIKQVKKAQDEYFDEEPF